MQRACIAVMLTLAVCVPSSCVSYCADFYSYFSASSTLPEYVILDPLRVRQVIANGITNALKYTRTGTVQLHVSCCPAQHKFAMPALGCDTTLYPSVPHTRFCTAYAVLGVRTRTQTNPTGVRCMLAQRTRGHPVSSD
jgi:signal transduction histidine kinase